MRDHPDHEFTILGGMFGTKKNPDIKSWIKLMNNFLQLYDRMYDQNFLRDIIYPIIKNNAMIHASFFKIENELCKNFPIPYDNQFRFVGEYVYEDESRSQKHIDKLIRRL